MLTKADNELVTRVGPGAPMGELMRQYWIPLLLRSELAQPDGPPKRVRLLGEELIAFRDSDGKVGLLANNCPHRGASLFFGRNEESGLRCVYHGWKFDTAGSCTDMPNEPAESNFKDKVRAVAYPCRELNGVIWTYMGPHHLPPELPEFGWALAPESQRYVIKYQRACNWLQGLEGDIDSSHLNYLHSRLKSENDPRRGSAPAGGSQRPETLYMMRDGSPRLEAVDTEIGVMYAARRNAEEDTYYYRVTQFLLPFTTSIASIGGGSNQGSAKIWVPQDDGHTMIWELLWDLDGPIDEDERARMDAFRIPTSGFLPNKTDSLGDWRFAANKSNDYLIDRERQRTVNFTGFEESNPLQDGAVQESMGSIFDRSTEHLGTTDAMIIRVRQRLLHVVSAFAAEGITPPGVDEPSWFRLRGVKMVLPRDASWIEAAKESMRVVV